MRRTLIVTITAVLGLGLPVVGGDTKVARGAASDDTAIFPSTDVPLSIPDEGTIESTVTVADEGTITDIDVSLDLSHPFDSDLLVELISPGGVTVTLADNVGSYGDGFAGTTFDDEASDHIVSGAPPFTGDFHPNDPLSVFDGAERAGIWTLRVTDLRGGFTGMLEGWALEISTRSDTTPPTGEGIEPFGSAFRSSGRVKARWKAGADDGSGVASRDVHYFEATNDAGFGPPVEWRTATTELSGVLKGKPGSTYCFTERLRDVAGNVSSFSELECTALPVNDEALEASGGWKHKSGGGYYRGDYLVSRKKGASLSLGVSGERFALVATRCPGCGKVDVFFDSSLVQSISLAAKSVKKKQVIEVATLDALLEGELRIVVASKDKKVIVEGVGVGRAPIHQLPGVYGSVGAPAFAELPATLPGGETEILGTLITVTNDSDVTNGTTSSASALQASPGPDGISLWEALHVTNNDPGEYTILFDPSLKGATIVTDNYLPFLTGGGVFVNGDVDADGVPDVTLEKAAGSEIGWAFGIYSSGNRLHGLVIDGFDWGVWFWFVEQDFTFERNVFTGLVMRNVTGGVRGFGGNPGFEGHWTDTRIVGNTIEATTAGLELLLGNEGNSLEDSIAANNSIRTEEITDAAADVGITFSAGFEPGGSNEIRDLVIAYNSLDLVARSGILISSGALGGQDSVIDGLRILGNSVHQSPPSLGAPTFESRVAITLGTGDGASNFLCPECPIVYPERNTLRDVEVIGNRTEEGLGVALYAGCCGAADNVVEDVRIEGNSIETLTTFGISVNVSGSGSERASSDNTISSVDIVSNTISMLTPVYEPSFDGQGLDFGGIVLKGGDGAEGSLIRDVSIIANRVEGNAIGIDLVGGLGSPQYPASGNVVSQIELRGNLIVAQPTDMLPYYPWVKGLSLIGGGGTATSNTVSCVSLIDNIVVGVLNDFAAIPDVSALASSNVATTQGC